MTISPEAEFGFFGGHRVVSYSNPLCDDVILCLFNHYSYGLVCV